jgi:AraC family transcriptional regulator of adaptative response/methylated-DNA-[protein]-cysteine methyltransferase
MNPRRAMTILIAKRPAPMHTVALDADALDAARHAAIAKRDVTADGSFVFSVRTTGVYCRPSCPARPAKPENIAFHPDCAAAEAAGFRPCRRCRPNEASQAARHAEAVARACRLIETSETVPSLDALAKAAGLSAYHFHRVFKGATGVTPRAYASADRAGRVEASLRSADTITEALYDAGFNAASRFYETANDRLGMTPSAYRAGGAGVRIRFAVANSALGRILVAATEKGICAILMGETPEALGSDLRERFPEADIVAGDGAFEALVSRVVGFVEAPCHELDLPLDIGGTAFQQRVWAALRAIAPGTTSTYSEIARAIGNPKAVRAVASACASNPIAVAIPCHRVLRRDGAPSGYRWGMKRKQALLAREGLGETGRV